MKNITKLLIVVMFLFVTTSVKAYSYGNNVYSGTGEALTIPTNITSWWPSSGPYGIRVTLVNATTGVRISGSVSADYSDFEGLDGFSYFPKVNGTYQSKLDYINRGVTSTKISSLTSGGYQYKLLTTSTLPKLITGDKANANTVILNYFIDNYSLSNDKDNLVALLTDLKAGSSLINNPSNAINGNYAIVVEPIAYFAVRSDNYYGSTSKYATYVAATATEATMLMSDASKSGNVRTLTNVNLPRSLYVNSQAFTGYSLQLPTVPATIYNATSTLNNTDMFANKGLGLSVIKLSSLNNSLTKTNTYSANNTSTKPYAMTTVENGQTSMSTLVNTYCTANGKSYCTITCQEDMNANFPSSSQVLKSGTHFVFEPIEINGSKTCTATINMTQLINDYNAKAEEVRVAYNAYANAKARYDKWQSLKSTGYSGATTNKNYVCSTTPVTTSSAISPKIIGCPPYIINTNPPTFGGLFKDLGAVMYNLVASQFKTHIMINFTYNGSFDYDGDNFYSFIIKTNSSNSGLNPGTSYYATGQLKPSTDYYYNFYRPFLDYRPYDKLDPYLFAYSNNSWTKQKVSNYTTEQTVTCALMQNSQDWFLGSMYVHVGNGTDINKHYNFVTDATNLSSNSSTLKNVKYTFHDSSWNINHTQYKYSLPVTSCDGAEYNQSTMGLPNYDPSNTSYVFEKDSFRLNDYAQDTAKESINKGVYCVNAAAWEWHPYYWNGAEECRVNYGNYCERRVYTTYKTYGYDWQYTYYPYLSSTATAAGPAANVGMTGICPSTQYSYAAEYNTWQTKLTELNNLKNLFTRINNWTSASSTGISSNPSVIVTTVDGSGTTSYTNLGSLTGSSYGTIVNSGIAPTQNTRGTITTTNQGGTVYYFTDYGTRTASTIPTNLLNSKIVKTTTISNTYKLASNINRYVLKDTGQVVSTLPSKYKAGGSMAGYYTDIGYPNYSIGNNAACVSSNGTVTIRYKNLGSNNQLDARLATVATRDASGYFTYTTPYSIESGLVNCNNKNIDVVYRPISLENPFPYYASTTIISGRESGYNWRLNPTYINNYITMNRGVSTEQVYKKTPMYVIDFTGSKKSYITTIKNDNKNNLNAQYGNYLMTCTGTDAYGNNNGTQCRSTYLASLKSAGVISGCGTDLNWNSCT